MMEIGEDGGCDVGMDRRGTMQGVGSFQGGGGVYGNQI